MAIQQSRQPYLLGTTIVHAVLYEASKPGAFYFNMHDDEDTAASAVLAVLPELGGTLLELQHGGTRIIDFELDGMLYRFDPNRIFTPQGVRATLESCCQYSDEAAALVSDFAAALRHDFTFDRCRLLVAVHNNGIDSPYSARLYLEGEALARDAADVWLNPAHHPDDFFFVTERPFFEKLCQHGFNVVLQDPERVTDDGSLSVYCAQHGIPYINVEAQHGHLAAQIEMLRALQDL